AIEAAAPTAAAIYSHSSVLDIIETTSARAMANGVQGTSRSEGSSTPESSCFNCGILQFPPERVQNEWSLDLLRLAVPPARLLCRLIAFRRLPHRNGIVRRDDPGAAFARIHCREFCTQQHDLRGIESPEQNDHQRTGAAVQRDDDRLAEIQEDQPSAHGE